MHRSMGPDEIYLQVLRELADVVAKPVFITCGSLVKFPVTGRGET